REYGNTGIYRDRGEDRDIMVVDRVGVLFDLYGSADAAFVGGSLVPRGGQNILEPAVWGVPFAHGSHMEDFAPHAKALGSLGASRMVRGSSELAREWERMISGGGNPGLAGRKYVENLGGASALAWNRISDILKGRE
ncbi:MAG TPA: 3-deoxy-D-manno-octulosonic acid transferase, partial [Synergistales bacterium]|nr:3-deoxy-D-manno-octulosonic acid transferase [Synergistales bacterium]